MIFTELLGSWMRDKQAYVLKRRTYLRYEEIIRTQITPSIGKLDTGELTIPILQSLLSPHSRNKAPKNGLLEDLLETAVFQQTFKK